MKTLLALILCSSPAIACNQHAYDEVYKTIIMRALASPLAKDDIDLKNDAIVTLRRLCNGQLSSWEKGDHVRRN